MGNSTLEKLIWVFIYAGLFAAGLGIWYIEHHLAVGLTLLLAGGGAIVAGAVLIWIRSRRA
jgi:uncharacterized membrane-anchored protein YitT (DUF2179 family)